MGFELFPAPLVDTLQQFCSNESNGILRPTNRQPVVMVVVQAGSCLMSIQIQITNTSHQHYYHRHLSWFGYIVQN